MKVKRIGIVLETKADAELTGLPMEKLYHWRETEEIQAVTEAIKSLGYECILIGPPSQLCNNLNEIRTQIDFLFNISVGFVTRNRMALAPALYTLANIPYSGADPYSKLLSQNKHLTKAFLDKLGFPTPPWVYISEPADLTSMQLPEYPLIVKPAYEGASIGMGPDAVVGSHSELHERVRDIFQSLHMPVIVEQFIIGREVKVGFIGDKILKFQGLIEDTVSDGSPMGNNFLYFDAKKQGSHGKVVRDFNSPEFSCLKRDCESIYIHFLPIDYATFDVRMDHKGKHYFLEINADATLHPTRTLAQCCALNGLSYKELIKGILESAFERQGIQ